MTRLMLLCILGSGLANCAVYSGKFNCAPAKGQYCTALHKVDEMISSGEIDKLDLNIKNQKRCKVCR